MENLTITLQMNLKLYFPESVKKRSDVNVLKKRE